MWMYAVAEMSGGYPTTDAQPYHGHVLIGERGIYGVYQFAGTLAELTAVAALATIVPLAAVTADGETRYPELANPVPAAIRNELNAWLTSLGLPNIPTGWTYRQLLVKAADVFSITFDDLDQSWVTDQ